VAWSLVRLWRRLLLAVDPRWLYLDLRLLSSGQRRASATVAPFSFGRCLQVTACSTMVVLLYQHLMASWSAVKSHLSVMTEAPVLPRAGASFLQRALQPCHRIRPRVVINWMTLAPSTPPTNSQALAPRWGFFLDARFSPAL